MRKTIVWILKGMCLGVANVIPGVSGGTMALVLGIYERLIDAIRKIGPQTIRAIFPPYPEGVMTKWKAEWERIDFFFLGWIGVGAAIAIVIAAKVIPLLMINVHDPTYGFFWGLILASIVIPWRMLKRFGCRQALALLVAAAVTTSLSYGLASQNIQKTERKGEIRDVKYVDSANINEDSAETIPVGNAAEKPLNATPPRLLYLALCGALAISAMILPGISGSFVLLLMGAYFDLFRAINQVRSLNLHPSNLLIIASIGVGTLIGILGFTRLLSYVFKKYHDLSVATLIGLMLGSLYGIWPFREFITLENGDRIDGMPIWPELNWNAALTLLGCLAGIATIAIFMRLESSKARSNNTAGNGSL